VSFHSAVGNALEVRRTNVDQIDIGAGGVFTVRQQFLTSGYGESTVPLFFTVRFVELPSVTTGWSMLPNQALQGGNYPVVHDGVFTWVSGFRVDNGYPYYDGAVMATCVLGDPNLNLVHHITFQGKAVRNIS
jgi:hypothetical protein